jgi:hypothetical protein
VLTLCDHGHGESSQHQLGSQFGLRSSPSARRG